MVATNWWSRRRAQWQQSFGRTATAADAVELTQRRIYLLPTGRGLFLIVTALVLLLVGINYQLSLAFVVAFLLAGLMQAALLVSYRNLRGLVVCAGRSPRCKVGESLVFSVALASPDRARSGVSLRAETGVAALLGMSHKASKMMATSWPLSIAGDSAETVPMVFSPTRRGVLPLGRITVASRAPYGLIGAWSYVNFEWIGLVEPQPETPPPSLPLMAGDDDGSRANKPHVAHDPDGLRDYVPGDSLKRVDWKKVAKSGDWYTRTGEAGQRQEIELAWQSVTLTDTEARLARMAAWLARAHNENCAYSLSMPNGALALADGSQQFADAAILLAAYPQRVDALRGLR
jgi:uncharacterized protein (DUF58 family)